MVTDDNLINLMKSHFHRLFSEKTNIMEMLKIMPTIADFAHKFIGASDNSIVNKQGNSFILGLIRTFMPIQKTVLSILEGEPYYDLFKSTIDMLEAVAAPNFTLNEERKKVIDASLKNLLGYLLEDKVSDEVKAEIIQRTYYLWHLKE